MGKKTKMDKEEYTSEMIKNARDNLMDVLNKCSQDQTKLIEECFQQMNAKLCKEFIKAVSDTQTKINNVEENKSSKKNNHNVSDSSFESETSKSLTSSIKSSSSRSSNESKTDVDEFDSEKNKNSVTDSKSKNTIIDTGFIKFKKNKLPKLLTLIEHHINENKIEIFEKHKFLNIDTAALQKITNLNYIMDSSYKGFFLVINKKYIYQFKGLAKNRLKLFYNELKSYLIKLERIVKITFFIVDAEQLENKCLFIDNMLQHYCFDIKIFNSFLKGKPSASNRRKKDTILYFDKLNSKGEFFTENYKEGDEIKYYYKKYVLSGTTYYLTTKNEINFKSTSICYRRLYDCCFIYASKSS